MTTSTPAHAQPFEDVLRALNVQAKEGLGQNEVRARREQHGHNRLRKAKRRSAPAILLDQFKSVVLIILAVAAALAFAFQEWPEGIAIVAVLMVNGVIGFLSEWRAVRSLEALQKISKRRVRVRRAGREQRVSVEALVPGDIVILEGGDLVPADLRLIEANNLSVDEAALTGESVSVSKRVEPVEADRALAERTSMLFKGTTVMEGSAEAVVVATGMATELGRIAELTEEAEPELTPLERRLNRLGWRLAWVTLGVAIVVAVVGLLAGQPTLLMIETAIALGLAAIPEGLPIVATIALARGMWLMARRQALVNRLAAVETLGATRVIFTDKTGTLTENRMTLRRVLTPAGDHQLDVGQIGEGARPDHAAGGQADDPLLKRVLEVGVLCNNASLSDANGDARPDVEHGDPTETALLWAGDAFELRRDELLERKPETREVAFDPDVMMMATFHQTDDGQEVAVKGAPQAVLEVCEVIATTDDRSEPMSEQGQRYWLERAEALAGEGLRVLAVADKLVQKTDEEPYQALRLLGLVGLLDPPRKAVRESVEACRSAGVRVVMVTGDQPETARAIGREVGLVDGDHAEVMHGRDLVEPDLLSVEQRERILKTAIFARVSPEQKLHLVRVFQDNGDTIAMTGDGVNDAPALKKADIGVAMGKRGTDAARQVADMVLRDDAFSSIVAAIQQGRIIFGNIRKSVMFMLCTNVAEVFAVALASLVNAPLPLRPLQILYLNVVTDVFPALALGVGKGSSHVMRRKPRDAREPVLTRSHWLAIGGWGLAIAACVLGALATGLLWLRMEEPAAITGSFLTLAFAKLWFVFNLRDRGSTLLDNDVVRNPWVWGSIGLCVALLLAATYLPGLSDVLKTRPLASPGWVLVLALSALPMLLGQTIRAIQGRRIRD